MHPLAALTARLFRSQPSTARRRPRLAVEVLEDRTAPAVFTVANGVDFPGGLLDPAASGVSARGGAVFLASGSLTIADSSFTGNQAPNGGAADCNQLASGRVFNLTRDTFTQNAANNGGAVNNNSN